MIDDFITTLRFSSLTSILSLRLTLFLCLSISSLLSLSLSSTFAVVYPAITAKNVPFQHIYLIPDLNKNALPKDSPIACMCTPCYHSVFLSKISSYAILFLLSLSITTLHNYTLCAHISCLKVSLSVQQWFIIYLPSLYGM